MNSISRIAVAAIAALALPTAAVSAAANPSCRAPECLIQLGPTPPAPPLRLDARLTNRAIVVRLTRPAVLTLSGDGRVLDQWFAPAGRTVHPPARAWLGPARLLAVDGDGDLAALVLPARCWAASRSVWPGEAAGP
jgi:hypothetical protein